MKKILSLCVILTAILFSLSCKKVNKLTQFDINYSNKVTVPAATYTINVPGDTTSVPAEFNTPIIPTDAANKFNAQKTSVKLIDEIKLTRLNISVATGNLDAIKSIAVYLKSSELGDQLIAHKSNIPAGSTSIVADVEDVNIKEYIFKESMQFKVVARMKLASRPEQELKMDETLHVKATLIK